MDRLTSIRVFINVADRGSLTAAAANLDMSRAMVSRHLQELETWLEVRLFHRSTRLLSLTDAGVNALTRCRQMLEFSDEMKCAVGGNDTVPRGLLRISTVVSFAQTHLATAVADYVALYPDTIVDIQAIDRTINLVEERIDLAIRITNSLDPNLIARKLGVCRSVVCASPEYLARRGTPSQPEELSEHNCLTYSYFGKSLWRFKRDGQPLSIPVCGNISANEVTVLTQTVLAGSGIALQPLYSVGPLIEEGRLVELLPHCQPQEMNIYGVYTSRRQIPATLRTMLDFLVDRFQSSPLF